MPRQQRQPSGAPNGTGGQFLPSPVSPPVAPQTRTGRNGPRTTETRETLQGNGRGSGHAGTLLAYAMNQPSTVTRQAVYASINTPDLVAWVSSFGDTNTPTHPVHTETMEVLLAREDLTQEQVRTLLLSNSVICAVNDRWANPTVQATQIPDLIRRATPETIDHLLLTDRVQFPAVIRLMIVANQRHLSNEAIALFRKDRSATVVLGMFDAYPDLAYEAKVWERIQSGQLPEHLLPPLARKTQNADVIAGIQATGKPGLLRNLAMNPHATATPQP